jgi:hypothetical protein
MEKIRCLQWEPGCVRTSCTYSNSPGIKEFVIPLCSYDYPRKVDCVKPSKQVYLVSSKHILFHIKTAQTKKILKELKSNAK